MSLSSSGSARTRRELRLVRTLHGRSRTLGRMKLDRGPVTLSVEATARHYSFSGGAGGSLRVLGRVPTTALSAEKILRSSGRHHFTGAMIGLVATGGGRCSSGSSPPRAPSSTRPSTRNCAGTAAERVVTSRCLNGQRHRPRVRHVSSRASVRPSAASGRAGARGRGRRARRAGRYGSPRSPSRRVPPVRLRARGSNSISVRAVSARCRWRRHTRAGDETSARDAGRPQSRRQPDRSRRDQLAREGLRTKTQPGESERVAKSSRSADAGCEGSDGPSMLQLERRHVRPSVRSPRHRRKKGLAAEVMVAARRRADPEKHGPRAPVVELDQVGVAGGLDRMPGDCRGG